MSNNTLRYLALKLLGLLICTLPPLIAVLSYFPLWLGSSGGQVLSGICVLLCIFAYAPILRALRRALESNAVWLLWLVLFIVFTLLSRIAVEVTAISLVGFIANVLGAIVLKLAERLKAGYEGRI